MAQLNFPKLLDKIGVPSHLYKVPIRETVDLYEGTFFKRNVMDVEYMVKDYFPFFKQTWEAAQSAFEKREIQMAWALFRHEVCCHLHPRLNLVLPPEPIKVVKEPAIEMNYICTECGNTFKSTVEKKYCQERCRWRKCARESRAKKRLIEAAQTI